MDCLQVNCLAGIVPDGVNLATLRETVIETLKFAADPFEKDGIKLLIEPINPIDIPGFHPNSSQRAVGSDNLYLQQYDVHHMQIVEGDLARTIEAALPASRTSGSPTIPGGMSQAVAKSTIPSCSITWPGSVVKAGSAANTGCPWRRQTVSAGCVANSTLRSRA